MIRFFVPVFVVLFPLLALAEDVAAGARTTGFVAAKTPTTVPGGPLLMGAYGIVWLVLFGYLYSISRRQREVLDAQRALALEVKALKVDE